MAQNLLDIDVAHATCGRIEDSHALTEIIQGAAAALQEAAGEVAKAEDKLAKAVTESENVEAETELKRAQKAEERYRAAHVGFDEVISTMPC